MCEASLNTCAHAHTQKRWRTHTSPWSVSASLHGRNSLKAMCVCVCVCVLWQMYYPFNFVLPTGDVYSFGEREARIMVAQTGELVPRILLYTAQHTDAHTLLVPVVAKVL